MKKTAKILWLSAMCAILSAIPVMADEVVVPNTEDLVPIETGYHATSTVGIVVITEEEAEAHAAAGSDFGLEGLEAVGDNIESDGTYSERPIIGGGITAPIQPTKSSDNDGSAIPIYITDGESKAPASDGVEPVTNANGEIATTAQRAELISYASQFLGNPYVYGGTSLTKGTDCSGFVMSVFSHFGINTGRSSRDQARNAQKISKSELQPGDLIFYASGNTIDSINHVAIYIGDGKIIHAATAKTGIVTGNAYYRTPFMYGRFIED